MHLTHDSELESNENDRSEINQSTANQSLEASLLMSRENVVRTSNVGDKSAAIVNIFFMIGSFIGPILGGGLEDSVGFTKAVLFVMALALVYGVIYAICTICFKTKY